MDEKKKCEKLFAHWNRPHTQTVPCLYYGLCWERLSHVLTQYQKQFKRSPCDTRRFPSHVREKGANKAVSIEVCNQITVCVLTATGNFHVFFFLLVNLACFEMLAYLFIGEDILDSCDWNLWIKRNVTMLADIASSSSIDIESLSFQKFCWNWILTSNQLNVK